MLGAPVPILTLIFSQDNTSMGDDLGTAGGPCKNLDIDAANLQADSSKTGAPSYSLLSQVEGLQAI